MHGQSYICSHKHAYRLIYVDSCVKYIVLTLIKYTDMVSHETNVKHLLNVKFRYKNKRNSSIGAFLLTFLQIFKKHTHRIPQALAIASELAISLRRWSNIDIWHAECAPYFFKIFVPL